MTTTATASALTGYVAPDNADIATILGKLTGITSLANWLRTALRNNTGDATALAEINSGGGHYDDTYDSLEVLGNPLNWTVALTAVLNTVVPANPTTNSVFDYIKNQLSKITNLASLAIEANVQGHAQDAITAKLATIVAAMWAAATSAIGSVVGSIGSLLVTNVDAKVSSIPATDTADVWSYPNRTLTPGAARTTPTVANYDLTLVRGDSWLQPILGLGILAAGSKIYFTARDNANDPDSASALQLERSGGLLVLNGAPAATPGDGVLSVTDWTAGNLLLTLKAVETATLTPRTISYDVQVVQTDGTITTVRSGNLIIPSDITRATS